MKKLNKVTGLMAVIGAIGMSIAACGSSTVSKKAEGTESAAGTAVAVQAADQQPANSAKTIIVDVRTVEEWNGDGHADCSINIPLQEFEQRMGELKGYGKVVLVCRSGGRAGKAKEMLEATGVTGVENLGPWQNVKCQ